MANAPFPDVGSQDSLEQLRAIVGEISQLLNWLFQGNIDSLNVRRLTADKVTAGTLLAALVTIRANLTGAAFIRIDGNGMTVNDGTRDVFTVDINGKVTMTGALVQSSASSYPRVELNSVSTLFKAAQTANERIEIAASYSAGTPALLFYQGGTIKSYMQLVGTDILFAALLGYQMSFSANNNINFTTTSGADINLSAAGAVNLAPTGALKINGTTGFTGTFVAGAQTVTVTKGIITSVV